MRAAMWWIDRWRQSDAFARMTAEEQGLYRNLCDEVVLRADGVIPDDPRILAKASGDHEAWARSGESVLKSMKKVRGGWTNPTALEVKNESERRSRKQRDYRNRTGNASGNAIGNEEANDADNKPRPPEQEMNMGKDPFPKPEPIPVQPPSSPSVDSRTDADAARAEVREALADWRKRHPEHVNVGMNDFHLLASVTEFFAPTGPVRPDSSNVNLLRATAAKIRAHGRPKPAKARKVTAPTWELMANSEQEAMRTAAIRWVEENWHLDAEPGDYESLSTLIRSANPPEDIAVAVSLIIRGRYPTLKHGEAYPCADELCTMGGCILARSASLAPSPEAHDGPTNETSVDTSHQGAETHEIGAKGPAPKTPALPRPALSLTVAPGSCPECGSPLRHSTEGGETILRCSDDQGFGCMWAAVWRSVAA